MDPKHTPGHTAEPWKASGMDINQDVGAQYVGRFIAFTGPSVRAMQSGYPAACEAEDIANAQRAVACVNACAGIANPAELRAQRDELLAAMKRYLPLIERAESDPAFWVPLSAGLELATANYYRAAIAKAEGGAR